MYEIRYSHHAEKYFKKLKDKKLKKKFYEGIINISKNPYIGEEKHGDLSGIFSLDIRYDGVNYELSYKVYEKNNKLVVVILAGTRENFYNELKRIAKQF